MSFDLVAMGELLVDFTPAGVSENGNPVFERNPGGGPANLACGASRLGVKTAFIGKVGDDNFGRALKAVMSENGVDTCGLLLSREYKTTLAFVHLDADGDRSFSFYRKNGADTMLRFEEVDLSILDGCQYFYCSSVFMAEGESRRTSFEMLEEVKRRGIPVVFDPNLRLNLWESGEEAKEQIQRALAYADIVKLSEEELVFLTGEKEVEQGARLFRESYPCKALLVTLGSKGCRAYTAGCQVYVNGYFVRTVDTTAAGDSFTGGFIFQLLNRKKDISEYTEEELKDSVRFANMVGALTTTRRGGIPALPDYEEVADAMANDA